MPGHAYRPERDPVGPTDGPPFSDDWCVPWSDLMMTMFVLFTVLFVYKAAEREIGDVPPPAVAPAAPSEPDPGRAAAPLVFRQAEAAVREANLRDVSVELQQDRSVKLSLRGPLFFDSGRADLRPRTKAFLEGVAGILRGNRYEVQVVGHTDSLPVSNERFATNWELSAVRATTVARYLIERGELAPGRFTVLGHSMYRPVLPNSSAEQRSRNRRVEIIIAPTLYPEQETPRT